MYIIILPPMSYNFHTFKLKWEQWREMAYYINKLQINNLIDLLSHQYKRYGPQKSGNKIIFDLLKKLSELRLFSETVIPFKNILLPNNLDIISNNLIDSDADHRKKIALLGLRACDLSALDIFLKQFANFNLVLNRDHLFVLAVSCKPDDDCFCDVFDADKISGFDLYLQKEGERFSIFAGSAAGRKMLDKLALKSLKNPPQIYPLYPLDHLSHLKKDQLPELIENRKLFEDYWQGIANNCFGCGACTAVCPLCFCFKQEFSGDLKGAPKQRLIWDSCFAKEFSEIQNHCDLRPENVDRLYNWYHHKFVRGPKEINKLLCVGCGRCIKACPAHLNMKNILQSLEEQGNEK